MRPYKQILFAAISTLICAGIGIAIYGIPNVNRVYYKASFNPFNPVAHADPRRESFLPTFLGYLLPIKQSEQVFTSFFLALYWVAIFVLVLIQQRKFDSRYAFLWPLFFLFFPTTIICHFWSAPPDALTFLLTLGLFFVSSPVAVFVLGALGSLNHSSMWMIIAPLSLVLRSIVERKNWRFIAAGIGGIVLGFIALKAILIFSHITFARSRYSVAENRHILGSFRTIWTRQPLGTFYSFYFAHWLLLPVLIHRLYQRNKIGGLFFFAAQAVGFCVGLLAVETTRVFTFLTWGAFFYVMQDELRHERAGPQVARIPLYKLIYATVALSAMIPQGFSRVGNYHQIRDWF